MKKFENTFTVHLSAEYSPSFWRSYFIPLDLSFWSNNQSGLIRYCVTKHHLYHLGFEFVSEQSAFSIAYSLHHSLKGRGSREENFTLMSLGRTDEPNRFVTNASGTDIPTCTLINPVEAFKLLSEFLENPIDMHERVKLIDPHDFEWPEY